MNGKNAREVYEQPEGYETPLAPKGKRNTEIVRQPTDEEENRTREKLKTLGKLFEGTDVDWNLDGGVCISLFKGELIRHHVDIDISLEEEELEKVSEVLETSGYGFFFSKETGDGREYIRVSPEDFSRRQDGQRVLRTIDDEGKITRDRPLGFIDVHLIRRNADGNRVTDEGVVLPKDWDNAVEIEFEDTTIRASHPAMVAYYKMHGSGVKDEYDLKMLAQTGVIKEHDIAQLEELSIKEVDKRKKYINDQLQQISAGLHEEEISSEAQQGTAQIRKVLEQQPFTGMMDAEQYEFLTVLAQQIHDFGSDQETIQDIFYKSYDIDSHLQKPAQNLEHFKIMCGIEQE